MSKNCVYCKAEIKDRRSVDVCDKCGVGVWGPKMFKTILDSMNDADSREDLCSTNTHPFSN